MKRHQLAAQLYTVRNLCQSPEDTRRTLQAIQAMGYAGVEIAGIPMGDPSQMNRMVQDAGLSVCAVHGGLDAIFENPSAMIQMLEALSSKFFVYAYSKGFDLTRAEDVQRLVKKIAAAGKAYHEAGIQLCYHHHSLEFVRLGQSTVLDHLISTIDPQHLAIELDTYWVQHGGGTPDRWCQKLAGRLPILHLKDYGNIGGTPTMMEIGNGNLDWDRILPAAEEAGCQWFVVEQDTCPGNPLDSLKASFDFLAPRFPKD